MLTKELVRYHVRKNRIYPSFIDTGSQSLLHALAEMQNVVKNLEARPYYEVKQQLEEHTFDQSPAIPGLIKLFLDQCEWEVDEGIASKRWQHLLVAQTLRNQCEDYVHFQNIISEVMDKSFSKLKEQLYADHPNYRILIFPPKMKEKTLLDHYNLLLVRGILLRAKTLRVSLPQATLQERRTLMRALKFHRLMCREMTRWEESSPFQLEINGPLQLFDYAQSYGIQFANFFPNLLGAKEWIIHADIEIRKHLYSLKLDHHSYLKTSKFLRLAYVPEEFKMVVDSFRLRENGWEMIFGEDMLNFGGGSYCFPDFSFLDKNGKKFHLELFHKWHRQEFLQRLSQLVKHPFHLLIIGASNNITKNIKFPCSETRKTFQRIGFEFTCFPTVKKLEKKLKECFT